MQTAHDTWLEQPYQDAYAAADAADARREFLLTDHTSLSSSMKFAADSVADDLAEVLAGKTTWTDADALLFGRILMDELRRLAETEVRS